MKITWENAPEIVDRVLREAVASVPTGRYDDKAEWLAEITFATTSAATAYLSWIRLRNESWFPGSARAAELVEMLQYVIATAAAAPLKNGLFWSVRRTILDEDGVIGLSAHLDDFKPSLPVAQGLLESLSLVAERIEVGNRGYVDPAAYWAFQLAVGAAEAILTIRQAGDFND